jgi:hypothetical protein
VNDKLENFIYWLDGFLTGREDLNKEKIDFIQDKIFMILNSKIDDSKIETPVIEISTEELLKKKVSYLGLSNRISYQLKIDWDGEEGVNFYNRSLITVNDLLKAYPDIWRRNNIGPKSLADIKNALYKFKLIDTLDY